MSQMVHVLCKLPVNGCLEPEMIEKKEIEQNVNSNQRRPFNVSS